MKTITLTQIRIHQVTIDYNRECVEVRYSLADAAGRDYETGTAAFWRTIPAETSQGQPGTSPDWFQLPPTRLPQLVAMRQDIQTALENRLLP